MKYVVCVGDGMADFPLDNLNGLTPLQCARTPNMDKIAKLGRCGLARTIPKGMPAGTDVANLSLLGYDPHKIHCGRAPFEAASRGIDLQPNQIAFRCNFVTVADGILVDHSGGRLSTGEARELIKALNAEMAIQGVKFYLGEAYRHLVVLEKNLISGNLNQLNCVSPHDILGQKIEPNLPAGPGADFLYSIMIRAGEILQKQEINHVKIDLQENPANFIWLWGAGMKPELKQFQEVHGIKAGIVTTSDLLRGLAIHTGIEVIQIARESSVFDGNSESKADGTLRALERNDMVFVHSEAPVEASHSGSLTEKVKAIEIFDEKVLGTILEVLTGSSDDWRIMILSDNVTPVALQRHVAEPVPFAIMGKGIEKDNVSVFSETAVKKGGYKIQEGYNLLAILLSKYKFKGSII